MLDYLASACFPPLKVPTLVGLGAVEGEDVDVLTAGHHATALT